MAKERGQPEPVLHARGLLWEKELTGRRSAASSSQTTAAQKEETSWGCCDMSRSFSISLFTCLPLPFTKQTYARHMCNTLPSIHSHASLSQWHTLTPGREIHKKLAGCLCSNKNTQNKPGKAEFVMESVVCFAYLERCLWRLIISSVMEMKYSSSAVFWGADDRNSSRQAFVLISKTHLFALV